VTRTFVHPVLGEENDAIGGHYALVREVRLPDGGLELLYLVGYGVVDRSCCGVGGCGYVLVPGYVVGWQTGEEGGRPVSEVEPVTRKGDQDRLADVIRKRESIQQVRFLE
jgi:hypothetical protein